MSIGVSTVKNGYNASNNSNIKSSDTPIFNHYDLSPPVEEFNTSIFIPPYQNNTKFVNESPINISPYKDGINKNETRFEKIHKVKINSQYNISAPVKHNRYQTYLASFQYGIKNLNGDKEENSVLEVKANNLFPPQLSEISCSSFNEFATAVCKYLESHHIKYTESVNYEGDKSDVYHSHSSLDYNNHSIGKKEIDEDPMKIDLDQDKTIRTLIIDCYLKLEQKEDDNNSNDSPSNDIFFPHLLLENNSVTKKIDYLIEGFSKNNSLADCIHFQMTVENISVDDEMNNTISMNDNISKNTPKILYVRTVLDSTGVRLKEEKIFNDLIQGLIISLK